MLTKAFDYIKRHFTRDNSKSLICVIGTTGVGKSKV